MKVRATQDGTYGGYYRVGPSPDGAFPGEVFEIDDKVFECRDVDDRPILELDDAGKPIQLFDEKGKARFDRHGKPLFKIKMGTWFSPSWMEKVSEDEDVTFDLPEFQIPIQYREPKKRTIKSSKETVVHSPAPVPSVI